MLLSLTFLHTNLKWLMDWCKIALFKRHHLWQATSKALLLRRDEKISPFYINFPDRSTLVWNMPQNYVIFTVLIVFFLCIQLLYMEWFFLLRFRVFFLHIKSIFMKIQMGRTVYLAFLSMTIFHCKVVCETKMYRDML